MIRKQFYWSYFYTCRDPQFIKLPPNVKPREKIIYSTDVHTCNRTDTFLILTMDSKRISRYGYNYATEILTGIKIPILGYTGYHVVGLIKEPFCVRAFIDCSRYDLNRNGKGLFPPIIPYSYTEAEWMKQYINDHIDPDGSFTTFTKQLQEMIEESRKRFREVNVPEPEKPVIVKKETPQDVYADFVKTRRNQN